jgi:2-oxoglutarate ferredoxin oxidoreductase subunit alpha
MDVTKMTREALKDAPLGTKEKDRAKNMFVLGFLYWMYGRDMKSTEKFIEEKFAKSPTSWKAT